MTVPENCTGPYELTADLKPVPRNVTWNAHYRMLFIDNPVGAGFSYTSTGQYCSNTKDCVAANLYTLLTQFYTMFDELQTVPLFITGESYGGHYVPAIGAHIVKQNLADPPPVLHLPLAGVAVGDGWVDPAVQIAAYPSMMFGMGLISEKQVTPSHTATALLTTGTEVDGRSRAIDRLFCRFWQRVVIEEYCDHAVELIEAGQFEKSFEVWDKMLNGDIWPCKITLPHGSWLPTLPCPIRSPPKLTTLPPSHSPTPPDCCCPTGQTRTCSTT